MAGCGPGRLIASTLSRPVISKTRITALCSTTTTNELPAVVRQLVAANDAPDRGGVDEGRLREVEHEVLGPALERAGGPLLKPRSAGKVELALDGQALLALLPLLLQERMGHDRESTPVGGRSIAFRARSGDSSPQ